MKESGQEYWNSVANAWERFGDGTHDVEKYIKEILEKYLVENKDDLLLNLGSGGGDRYLHDMGSKLVHLDYSRNMLIANKMGLKIEADARDILPIKNKSFGNITSFFLMRYLSFEQQTILISESSRLLKVDGSLIIVDIPDNRHQYQVDKFEPNKFISLLESLKMEILENQVIEREVSKWISTGFGGWYTRGNYNIGIIVARKR